VTPLGALGSALERAFGAPVKSAERLAGGDINDAYAVELGDGRRLFVKTNADAPVGMFEAEARGLAWLAAPNVVRVPQVLGIGSGDGSAYLALELIQAGPRRRGFDEALGRALAALHRATPDGFGLDHSNFIGSLPQSNRPSARWADFYRGERLVPQLELAVQRGRASVAMRRGFERLFARLDALVGPDEPPARLHGDLWGGNLHVTADGAPCLIDPAAYGGHREVDLAMMRLFGGFADRVFAAYAEAHPLAPGHAERVALYQLYPLMVHVNLFGGSYAGSVERTLGQYA
jgi:fructosamine-3-kinase